MGFHDPACRAFHVEQLCTGQGFCDRFLVAAVDVVNLYLHTLQDSAEKAERIRIDMAHRNDAITRIDEGQHA